MTTMDFREKMVELLREAPYNIFGNKLGNCYFDSCIELIADHIIAKGVTVQEWISVEDRLPEPKEKAICLSRDGEMMIGIYTEWGWMFPCYFEEPTHWMPLPEPPKGE